MKKLIIKLRLLTLLGTLPAMYALQAQDNCNVATALTLQNATCTSTVTGTTAGATASPQTALIPFAADDDVWYTFTTPAGSAEARFMVVLQLSDVTFTGASTGIYIERREGSANICDNFFANNHYIDASQANKSWTMTGLLPATQYSIRLYTDGNTSRMNFKICAYIPTPPPNDNCGTAQVLTAGSTCVPTGPFNTLTATAGTQPSGDGTGRDDDVWFSFTTGASPQKYMVQLSSLVYNTGFGNPVIELWDNCNGTQNVQFAPFATKADFGVLNPSTTYFVRVYTYGSSSRFSSFSICLLAITPPPNDECAGAIPVQVGSSGFGTPVNGTTQNAGQSNQPVGSCSVFADDDVWYSFTAPATGIVEMKLENVVHPENPSSPAMDFILLSGPCADPTVVACGTGNSSIFSALTPGQTYRLRLMTQDAGNAANFTLSLRQLQNPANDNCTGAVMLTVNTNHTYTITTEGTTVLAGPSGVATTPCNALASNDVWYSFVAPASGAVQFRLSNVVNPAAGSTAMLTIAYGGNCAAISHLQCFTGSNGVLTGLTPGATYYLRTMSNSPGQSVNFRIGVLEILPQQSNIDCGSARNLTTTWQRGSTLGLPMLNNITACYGGIAPNKVVYYQFTATATTHYIDFKDWVNLSLNANGLGYRVYSGDCTGNPVTKTLKCVPSVNNANDTIPNLTIGETYTVLVMENSFNGGTVEFSLRLAPANTNVWVGTIDDSWNKAGNWSLGQVPDANSEVIIPGGRRVGGSPRYPVLSANTTVRSLKIDPGGRVDVAAGVVITVTN